MTAIAAERYTGASIKRSEDPRILTGAGRYVDDIKLPGMLHAAFVRSPMAHARVLSVDVSAARALPGASVQVRIVSTSARASTAFQGKTASDGVCPISFMVPSFPNGNAAVVIRVTGPSAGTEVQFPIRKK